MESQANGPKYSSILLEQQATSVAPTSEVCQSTTADSVEPNLLHQLPPTPGLQTYRRCRFSASVLTDNQRDWLSEGVA
jgi:hypothetical protein